MADLMDENGNRIMAIGPLSTAMPLRFHNHVSRDILKSYLAHNEEYGNKLQKQTFPADIPVIVKEYTNEVYPEVLKKLNHIGEDAVKEIHPWVLCTLIDWSDFDKVICCTANLTDDKTESETSTSSVMPPLREEIQVETVEENSGPFSSQPNTDDPSSDSSQVLNSDQANGKSFSSSDASGTAPTKWTKEKVLQLIDLHSQHEQMFNKPSMKKKHVWSIIAAKLRDKTFEITPEKVEQKWKNMTKTFRDTVDHNNKSGNAPKQCPYFEELQEAYGYRPNVKPEFTCAAGCSDSSNSKLDSSTSTETSAEEGCRKTKAKKMKMRQNRNDVIIDFLREMKNDMVRDQEVLLETFNKQHQDRMKNEEKKLELIGELVKAVKK